MKFDMPKPIQRNLPNYEDQNPIKITSSFDRPFGRLSNNFTFNLIIDGENWRTVSNYVLANMLDTPLYRLQIKESAIKGEPRNIDINKAIRDEIELVERNRGVLSDREAAEIAEHVRSSIDVDRMDIYHKYKHYQQVELASSVRQLLQVAYEQLATTSDKFVQVLLSTENRPLVYLSKHYNWLNKLITSGIIPLHEANTKDIDYGKVTRGSNLVVLILYQIRQNLQSQRKFHAQMKQIELVKQIINVYLLLNSIATNLRDSIQYFKEIAQMQSYGDIIQLFNSKNIRIPSYDIDYYYAKYRQGNLPIISAELAAPGEIIRELYQQMLAQHRSAAKRERLEILADVYLGDLVEKINPGLPKDQVKISVQQFLWSVYEDSLDNSPKLDKFYEDLQRALKENKLPESVINEYNQRLSEKKIDIPEALEINLQATKYRLRPRKVGKGHKNIMDYDEKKEPAEDDNKIVKEFEDQEEPVDEKPTPIWQVVIKPKNPTQSKILEDQYIKEHPEHKNDKENIKENYNIIGEYTSENPNRDTKNKILADFNKKLSHTMFKHAHSRRKIREPIDQKEAIPREEKPAANYPVDEIINIESGPYNILMPNFALERDGEKITIDGLDYPDVLTYLWTMLLAKTIDVSRYEGKTAKTLVRTRSFVEARELIIIPIGNGDNLREMVKSYREMALIYEENNIQTERLMLETYANTAMKKKFADADMQNILLLTGNREIINFDLPDSFLCAGTPTKPGFNRFGEILMNIRHSLVLDKKKQIRMSALASDKLVSFITGDAFIWDWVTMRTNDMINVCNMVKKYIETEVYVPFDFKFVQSALTNVFRPCHSLARIMKQTTFSIPTIYMGYVNSRDGYPMNIERNFTQEIKDIQDKMDKAWDMFYQVGAIRQQSVLEKAHEIVGSTSRLSYADAPKAIEARIAKFKEINQAELEKELEDLLLTDEEKEYNVLKNPVQSRIDMPATQIVRKYDLLFEQTVLLSQQERNYAIVQTHIPMLRDEIAELETKHPHLSAKFQGMSKQIIETKKAKLAALQTELVGIEINNSHQIDQLVEEIRMIGNPQLDHDLNYLIKRPIAPEFEYLQHKRSEFDRTQRENWRKFVQNLGGRTSPERTAQSILNRIEEEKQKPQSRRDLLKSKVTNQSDQGTIVDEDELIHRRANEPRIRFSSEEQLNEEKKEQQSVTEHLGKSEILLKMAKKIEEQEKQYNIRIGRGNIKSSVEFERFEADQKAFTENIERLNREYVQMKNEKLGGLRSVSQAYWNNIVNTIMFLILYLPKNNSVQDLRRILASAEIMNNKNVRCKLANNNFGSELNVCIALALRNIIIGLKIVKTSYAPALMFNEHEIVLAGNIITDGKLPYRKTRLVNPDVERLKAKRFTEVVIPKNSILAAQIVAPIVIEEVKENNPETNKREYTAEDVAKLLGELDPSLFVNEIVHKDIEQYINEDDEGNIEDYGDEEDLDSDPDVGIEQVSEDIRNNVGLVISELVDVKPSDEDRDKYINEFIKVMYAVNNAKIPEHIKINRIMFFATSLS
jgi:predicted NAD-dependent protein-ADP-ribosyltransferase YbiA (DUF1768 family)